LLAAEPYRLGRWKMACKKEWIVAAPLAMELTWRGKALAGVRLDWAGRRKSGKALCGQSEEAAVAMAKYVRGEEPEWPEIELDMEGLSGFSDKVLRTLADEVPHGRTVSYGELAEMAGRPGAARAVGRVMACNRWPLLVPCHRVVGSNGKLTGFSGAGLPMKRFLLELEGVR
jgi:methylated-DNA-[protein]-cysteine S-methyltransferase